jgi:hypothetical protein
MKRIIGKVKLEIKHPGMAPIVANFKRQFKFAVISPTAKPQASVHEYPYRAIARHDALCISGYSDVYIIDRSGMTMEIERGEDTDMLV